MKEEKREEKKTRSYILQLDRYHPDNDRLWGQRKVETFGKECKEE